MPMTCCFRGLVDVCSVVAADGVREGERIGARVVRLWFDTRLDDGPLSPVC